MTFRVGQKVVCVDASSDWTSHGLIYPVAEGSIYTVRDLGVSATGAPGIRLCEAKLASPAGIVGKSTGKPFSDNFFRSARFRPVVERKTDISVFTEILRKATKPTRAPAVSQHQLGTQEN